MIDCFSNTVTNTTNEHALSQHIDVICEFDFIAKDVLEKIVKNYTNSATITNSVKQKKRIEDLFIKYAIEYIPKRTTDDVFEDIPF